MKIEWKVIIEKLLREWTMIKARLTRKGLPATDESTIQKHGEDLYIKSHLLQEGQLAAFERVGLYLFLPKNGIFVYKGVSKGADLAPAVLESNVPIEEILKSPSGNRLLQRALGKDNVGQIRDGFYRKIGEPIEPLQGRHGIYAGKPTFPIGCILQLKRGKFIYDREVSKYKLDLLKQERLEEANKQQTAKTNYVSQPNIQQTAAGTTNNMETTVTLNLNTTGRNEEETEELTTEL